MKRLVAFMSVAGLSLLGLIVVTGPTQAKAPGPNGQIAFARQAYNDAVMTYNVGREQFPAVLLAGPLGFSLAQLLEVEDKSQRVAPVVKF